MNKGNIKNILCIAIVSLVGILVGARFSHFQSSDDYLLSLILAGAQGTEYSEYVMFSNNLWTGFISLLCRTFPIINWYVIVSMGLAVASMVLIDYGILSIAKRSVSGCISCILINLFIITYSIIEFNFTYNAYTYGCAGFFCLYLFLVQSAEKKKKLWLFLAGFLMSVVCYLVRTSCFISLFLVWGIFIFAGSIQEIKSQGGKFFRWIKKYYIIMLTAVLLLLVCFGVKKYNERCYALAEWQEYREYNAHRSELLDYEFPDFNMYEEEYKELGITEQAINVMQTWCMEDTEVFSTETLAAIERIGGSEEAKEKTIENLATSSKMRMVLIFAGSLILLLCIFSKRTSYVFLLATGTIVLEVVYLQFVLHRMPFRSVYGLLLSLFVVFAFSLVGSEKFFCIEKRKFFETLLVCGMLIIAGNGVMVARVCRVNKETEDLYTYVEANKNQLFLLDMWTVDQLAQNTSPFRAYGVESQINLYPLGGCQVRNLRTNRMLAKYGVTNPFRAMAEGQDVVLIDNYNVQMKTGYMVSTYRSNVYAEKINEVAGYSMYKMTASEELGARVTGGVYDDGWMTDIAYISVFSDKEECMVQMDFYCPENLDGNVLTISNEGEEILRIVVATGNNSITWPVENQREYKLSWESNINNKRDGTGKDERNLTCVLGEISLY